MTIEGNAVRSVDRAASLLLALGETTGEAGVTELARRLGLHKSTTEARATAIAITSRLGGTTATGGATA